MQCNPINETYLLLRWNLCDENIFQSQYIWHFLNFIFFDDQFQPYSLDEALCEELLSAEHLALINPYQPNLSACWMFQRAMSVKIGSEPKPELIVGSSCHYANEQYHYIDSTAIHVKRSTFVSWYYNFMNLKILFLTMLLQAPCRIHSRQWKN